MDKPMIIRQSSELIDIYKLTSTQIQPKSGLNRRTGWNVNTASGGYFYADNPDFGYVEGSIDSSVTSNEQYVLTDFMRNVEFEPSTPIVEEPPQLVIEDLQVHSDFSINLESSLDELPTLTEEADETNTKTGKSSKSTRR